jgi:hypothetical protein
MELDMGVSPKQKLFDGLADTFNDESWVAVIPAMGDLHEDYAAVQRISKGEYVMTRAKVAEVLQSRKLEIKKISENFNLSGNGENMLGFSEDGEELMDGGKRAAFLRGKPSDLLYWWYIYESNDLLEMTFAEFGANAVDGSTGSSPLLRTPVTQAKRKASSVDDAQRQFQESRKQFSQSVTCLNTQMIESNMSSYLGQLITVNCVV